MSKIGRRCLSRFVAAIMFAAAVYLPGQPRALASPAQHHGPKDSSGKQSERSHGGHGASESPSDGAPVRPVKINRRAKRFKPAIHVREGTVHLTGAPEDVFPLFAPEWRRLYDERWKPETIFQPGEGKTEGQMLRIPTPFGDGRAILTFVNRYNTKTLEMRFSFLYQDVEIEKYFIRCKPNEDGGTEATIRIDIFGLSEFGNKAVNDYVKNRGLEGVMEDWRDGINKRLEEKND